MADAVLLTINGSDYGGWTSVEVQRSIEQISGAFTVRLTERWPGSQATQAITPGQAVKVSIGGTTVMTGYVDDVEPSYDADSHSVEIRGRDATGDLCDCSVVTSQPGGHWIAPSLLSVATDICKPFGIVVRANIAISSMLFDFVLQQGETAFEAIDRLAKYHGVLPTSDGQGGLLFTRAGSGGAIASLQLGKNIKKASGTYSSKDRFSVYYVEAQGAGSEYISPANTAGAMATAADSAVSRYRPLIVMSDMPDVSGNYQTRANWERNVRAGRSRQATITVNGWRDANGTLYTPNTMVQVDDDFLGIHDTLLISGVKLTLDEEGQLAALTVTRREAFDTVPMPSEDGYFDASSSPGAPSNSGAH